MLPDWRKGKQYQNYWHIVLLHQSSGNAVQLLISTKASNQEFNQVPVKRLETRRYIGLADTGWLLGKDWVEVDERKTLVNSRIILFCTIMSIYFYFCQIGRSTESPIDFVVTDTVPGSQSNSETQSVQSTISRFACRIICERNPPFTARIYAAGFDSSKNIFLGVRNYLLLRCSFQAYVSALKANEQVNKSGFIAVSSQEKAAKWKTSDGQMDGLTTNGVLVMHPRNGFTEDSKPGVWREISVCGNVFSLRETRSAQQRGKMVRFKKRAKLARHL